MAGPNVGYATLQVIPSMRGFDRTLSTEIVGPAVAAGQQAGKRIAQGVNDEVKKGIDRKGLSSALGDVAAPLAAGGAAAAFGLYKAVQASSALVEAQNKANVVLGRDGVAAVKQFTDAQASAYGLSKRAATDAAAGFAVFGKSAGLTGTKLGDFSVNLTRLAGDLASFSNTSVDDAITAIGAALRGETEPIRAYGVLLDDATLKARYLAMTGEQVTGSLTPQQRVLAANAELLRQTTDAQGDAIRTGDEFAGQQRQLKSSLEDAAASIGESLVPAAKFGAGALKGMAEGVSSLPGPLASVVSIGGAGAATLALIGGSAGLLVSGALRGADALSELKTKLNETSIGAGRAGTALKAIGTGVVVVGTVVALDAALESASESSTDLATNLDRIRSAKSGAETLDLFIERTKELDGGWEDLRDAFTGTPLAKIGEGAKATVVDVDNLDEALKNLADAGEFEKLATVLDQIKQAGISQAPQVSTQGFGGEMGLRSLNDVLDRYRDRVDAAGDATDAATKESQQKAKADQQAADASKELDAITAKLTARQKLLSFAFDASAAASRGFADGIEQSTNIDDTTSSALALGDSLRDLRKGLGLVDDAGDPASKSMDRVSEAMGRLQRAVADTDPALQAGRINLDALGAAGDAFERSFGDGGSVTSAVGLGDALRSIRKELRFLPADFDLATAAAGGYTKVQTDAIRALQDVGRASRDYLGDLLRDGTDPSGVVAAADQIRASLQDQLAQLGLNSEAIAEYIRQLGLAPDQITTAIQVAGLEQSRFKLNAYIQLLDGKIPPEVATEVIASINAGDLDAAAARLERFAATNPVRLDLGVDTGNAEKAFRIDLPESIDIAKAALGGYSEEQSKGLQAILTAGDAAKDFLANFAGDPTQLRAQADTLRGGFIDLFKQIGLTDEQTQQYLDLIGLSDWQIEAGISVAGFEESVAKIQTLQAILEGLDTPVPREILVTVGSLINEGNFTGAAAWLSAWFEQHKGEILVGADTGPAEADLNTFKLKVAGETVTLKVNTEFTTPDGQQVTLPNIYAKGPLVPGGPYKPGQDNNTWTPFAFGGLVGGVGSRDTVPAMLTPGEYVATKATVGRLGPSFFDALNAGATPAVPVGSDGVTIERLEQHNYGSARPQTGEDIVRGIEDELWVTRRRALR